MKIDTVRFGQIATAEGRSLSLDDRPAVYAWFRDLEGICNEAGTADELIVGIKSLLCAELSPRATIHSQFLYRAELWEHGGDLYSSTWEEIHRLLSTPEGVSALKEALCSASAFMAPLYIGKADKLRRRIGEHVRGSNSELKGLLDKAHVPLRNCLVRFVYLDNGSSKGHLDQPSSVRAVEELLTRLAPAAFVRKPG